jgi:hypothetical protein
MDLEDENEDPFKIRDLWKPSKFPLQPLQPLEPLIWDKELPGMLVTSFLRIE